MIELSEKMLINFLSQLIDKLTFLGTEPILCQETLSLWVTVVYTCPVSSLKCSRCSGHYPADQHSKISAPVNAAVI